MDNSRLTPADLARGTLGETWIRDEIAKARHDASSGPWRYPARSEQRRAGAWMPWIVGCLGFWIAVWGVVLCAS